MTDSILNSIKLMLGVEADETAFDVELRIFINSAFSVLHTVGATPPQGFRIAGATETWSLFFNDMDNVEDVQTYIFLRVKLWFDPPATSFTQQAIKEQYQDLEWRLNMRELIFNPHAFDYLLLAGEYDSGAFMWELDAQNNFPPEAQEGDLGLNPLTGNVYRKG